jgi:hypothetical protein
LRGRWSWPQNTDSKPGTGYWKRSWTIDTGNVDIAFSILAGFASSEIWHSYPLLLDGAAEAYVIDSVTTPR